MSPNDINITIKHYIKGRSIILRLTMLSLHVNREVSTAHCYSLLHHDQYPNSLSEKQNKATFRSAWWEDDQKSNRNKMEVIDSMKHFFDDFSKSVK